MDKKKLVGPQKCSNCGCKDYELYLLRKGNLKTEAAACSYCGRITGSAGDYGLRGDNIEDYQ
jgi:hypothetical protein